MKQSSSIPSISNLYLSNCRSYEDRYQFFKANAPMDLYKLLIETEYPHGGTPFADYHLCELWYRVTKLRESVSDVLWDMLSHDVARYEVGEVVDYNTQWLGMLCGVSYSSAGSLMGPELHREVIGYDYTAPGCVEMVKMAEMPLRPKNLKIRSDYRSFKRERI